MPSPTSYKAWLLFAPIWISDPLGEGMICPRPRLSAPLLSLSFACLSLAIPLYALLHPGWAPGFSIHITDPRWPGEERNA